MLPIVIGEIAALNRDRGGVRNNYTVLEAVNPRITHGDTVMSIQSDTDACEFVPRCLRRSSAKFGPSCELYRDAVRRDLNDPVCIGVADYRVRRNFDATRMIDHPIVVCHRDGRPSAGLDTYANPQEGQEP